MIIGIGIFALTFFLVAPAVNKVKPVVGRKFALQTTNGRMRAASWATVATWLLMLVF